MRPVNLLPQRYRSAGPSGGRSGSSYFLLGGLAAVLLGVVLYAFTANQVSSREADAVEARQAADAAEAEAGALAPFGDFRQVKDTRVEAVRTLAEGRLDWERLARELAYVLPRGVRLDSVEGSTTGEGADSGGSSASAPAPPPPPESSAPASGDSSTAGAGHADCRRDRWPHRRARGLRGEPANGREGRGAAAAPERRTGRHAPGLLRRRDRWSDL